MNISKISIPSFKGAENNNTNQHRIIKSTPSSDCFQKTGNVSFGYSFFDDLTPFMDFTFRLLDIIKREHEERLMQTLITALSDKGMQHTITTLRISKIEDLMKKLTYFDTLIPVFKDSGIATLTQLDFFVKQYKKTPATRQVFNGQEIEAVKIYGKLTRKDDLSNYPDLLLYLYNNEDAQDNPEYESLNTYPAFLRKLGINKFSEFEERFKHLKPQFNGFESISDKVAALDYIQSTYDTKTALLDGILKSAPSMKKNSAEKLYPVVCDIVDYYYDKNSGKSLEGLESVLELAEQTRKLKTQALADFGIDAAEADTEKKIRFFQFLNQNEISIGDFNEISRKSFIAPDNNSIKDKITNKRFFTKCIAEIKGISDQEAAILYRTFSSVINASYSEETGSLDNLKTLLNLVQQYKLKNQDGILRLYNEAYSAKKKNITTEELCEFLELFNYNNSQDIFADAKKQKTTAVKLLQAEKQKFLDVKPEIESFTESGESDFFTGETALGIYKKYHNLIQSSSDSVATTLRNIADFNSSDSTEQKRRTEEISNFTKYFSSKYDAIKFINTNQISFEEDNDSAEYKKNCIAVLEAISQDNSPQKEDRINYFINSGFLLKSRSQLSELIKMTPDAGTRKEVMAIIADKKIPSLNHMEKFFMKYAADETSGKKLLQYLRSLPENISFTDNIHLLENLEDKISELNLPIHITADNIDEVRTESLPINGDISSSQIVDLVNRIYNAPADSNFLRVLPLSTTDKTYKHNAHRLAEELVFKTKSAPASYQNIMRLLRLDKKSLQLPEDVSDYLYIRAIKEVLPAEFVEFVNSDDWLQYSSGEETPNLILHAKLRAIERFALNDADDISSLYSEETKEKLRNLFRTVYTEKPTEVRGTNFSKRFIVNHLFDSNIIEAVFSPAGEMITIVPKSK